MQIQDDRTPEQHETHTCIILGRDTFLSGWGKASDGYSYAGWACEPKHMQSVWHWVKSRSDMRNVRRVDGDYRPQGRGHYHIYVVNDGHRALED